LCISSGNFNKTFIVFNAEVPISIKNKFFFDVVFHDSLFPCNTQCSMQNVPALIPITGLTH